MTAQTTMRTESDDVLDHRRLATKYGHPTLLELLRWLDAANVPPAALRPKAAP